MSKSLNRVRAALDAAGLRVDLRKMTAETRTAEQAAEAAGCLLNQIVKSIIFKGEATGDCVLFLTAGGNRVDPQKASRVAGQPLGRADATVVRAQTGFAIGGVAPIGHLSAIPTFLDATLMTFDLVWAAAGTPNHIFAVTPQDLHRITGADIADFI